MTDCWKLSRVMKYKFRLIIAIFTLALLSGCVFFDHAPQKNPKPEQFMLISGTMTQLVSLQIIPVYATNNPACEVYVNWLELGNRKGPQTFTLEIPVQQKEDKYEATVPLDEFQEGDCQWRPFKIMVGLRLKGEPPAKFERDTVQSMHAESLIYFPNSGLNMEGVRSWKHGPDPITLQIFYTLMKSGRGDVSLGWWEDKIPGYNQNLFIITPQERNVTINVTDRTLVHPSP